MLAHQKQTQEVPSVASVASLNHTQDTRPAANCADRLRRFAVWGQILLGAGLALAAWVSVQAWMPHLTPRVFAALCGVSAAIYLGLAMVQPRVGVGLLSLMVSAVIVSLALHSLADPKIMLVMGFMIHTLWAGVQWFLTRHNSTAGVSFLPGWAAFCMVLAGLLG